MIGNWSRSGKRFLPATKHYLILGDKNCQIRPKVSWFHKLVAAGVISARRRIAFTAVQILSRRAAVALDLPSFVVRGAELRDRRRAQGDDPN
jgi:hypothetical protein